MRKLINERERRTKYTISQESKAYMLWNMVIICNCLYTCIVYPAYTLNGFPSINEISFWALCFSESFFFTDILLSFSKQEMNEEGKTKQESFEVISSKYLRSRKLKLDIISFLPIGWFISIYDQRLRFFWIIKATRLGLLNY
jgi:hypothetical protein